ncbi:MAG: prefoldin subunit alpha [Candidatus Bathyarchaeia archaeon]
MRRNRSNLVDSSRSSMGEDDLRRIYVEYRLLEDTAKVLQARLELLNSALNEVILASSTLKGLREVEGEGEALIPVGGGSFIRVKLAQIDKAIVGVGAGVCVEKGLEEAIHDFRGRQGDIERMMASVQEQLTRVLNEMEERRKALAALTQKREDVVRKPEG